MTATHSGNDYAELNGGVLGRLNFEWIGDRYQHRWLFGEDSKPVIESKESDHTMHWPISPPLQQVYRQTFDDGRDVMFGVGMAGRGHWSVSFTLVPDLKSWIVEWACRSSTEPQQLFSTYRLFGSWQTETNSSDQAINRCNLTELGLRLEPLSVLTRLEVRESELIILPDQAPGGQATIQWGIRLRVA